MQLRKGGDEQGDAANDEGRGRGDMCSVVLELPRGLQVVQAGYCRALVGAPVAGRAGTAVVMGAKVDGLAAEGAAVVNQGLVLFDGHLFDVVVV
ncbi:uncharacterized protein PG986_006011 [Apiospora aurea]|uniref:Uncharacterized protein n=1 Tax=Apiospora aurea TaxID=335848 RepID=A0ABR1QJL3_9PEZI